MRRLTLILALVLVASLALPATALADPPGMGDSNDGVNQVVKGNAVFTELQDKDPITWAILWNNGVYGWIVTHLKAGAFSGSLTARGLTPSTWYMVTLQDANGDGQNAFTGSDCLFGVKGPGFGLDGWCDVALFMTDAAGNADEVTIPTTSGLTAADVNVSSLGSGTLASGDYTGVTIAVKNVGIGMWGGVSGRPNWWGYPSLLWPGPGLYETTSISFKVK